MTDPEVLWLCRHLPRTTIAAATKACDEAAAHWGRLRLPPRARIAAQVAAIEVSMIQHGALALLGREHV